MTNALNQSKQIFSIFLRQFTTSKRNSMRLVQYVRNGKQR